MLLGSRPSARWRHRSQLPTGNPATLAGQVAPLLGWQRHERAVGIRASRPRRRDRGRGRPAGRARHPGSQGRRRPVPGDDVQKVRLATACERAGLPMEGIAAAIRAGRLSFAFLEAAPYRRWAVRSARTYRQVSQETGIPLDVLTSALESMGFARMAPEELIREDELEVVPLLQLGLSAGVLGPGLADPHRPGLRRGPAAGRQRRERGLPGAVHGAGAGVRRRPATVMELASQLATA